MDPILSWLEDASAAEMEKEFKVPFGSGGPPEYYFRLCTMIRESFSDFAPEGLDEWAAEQSEERIAEADRKLKELNIRVQKYIFDMFKKEYGEKQGAYFDRGVIDKQIKTRAYEKSIDEDIEDRLPLEHYLDFIDYKKVVEHKSHWPLFKPVFDIQELGEKGYAKNVRWMHRINAIRRVPAHPTERRRYKTDDLDYIDYIHEEFMSRLDAIETGSQPEGND